MNSAYSARWADSKKRTHDIWDSEDIRTPKSLFLPMEATRSDIESKLQEFYRLIRDGDDKIRIVVQPNFGTEGEDAADFAVDELDMQDGSRAFEHIYSLSRRTSVVVTKFVGDVFYSETKNPSASDLRRFVIRANVVYDGRGRGYR